MRTIGTREVGVVGLGCALLVPLLAGCASRAPQSRPQTREYVVTAVPLLTREMERIYGFLAKDFGPGGVLEGKEVYAFEPSSILVYEGDTLALTLVNPEDDAHSFVLPGLSVNLPPQSTVNATYVARTAGTYRYLCAIPAHLPFMYGTLVVLPASARRPG
jgi:uncharacterized cupredoxin-like copper-binding protein